MKEAEKKKGSICTARVKFMLHKTDDTIHIKVINES